MNASQFYRFVALGLSVETSPTPHETIREKEALAWSLHENEGPAGSILLGDLLLSQRFSYIQENLEAVPFARELLLRGFSELRSKEPKEAWDWYGLGFAHELGRGTVVDHRQAASSFREASKLGNEYSEYEEIWAAFLSGTQALETVYRLRGLTGPLDSFARLSASALSTLELGPVRRVGSATHVFRILELAELLHRDYYHEAASRYFNVKVQAEMREDIVELKETVTPTAYLTLYLIARFAPKNRTGEDAAVWLHRAFTPENELLASLVRRKLFDLETVELWWEICQQQGWTEFPVGRAVRFERDALEAENSD